MDNAGIYYVYILASGRHGTLYIGVTNNVQVRLEQHRSRLGVRQEIRSVPPRPRRNVPFGT